MKYLVLLLPLALLAGGIAFFVAGLKGKSGTIRGPGGTAPAGPNVMIGVGLVMGVLGLIGTIGLAVNLAD